MAVDVLVTSGSWRIYQSKLPPVVQLYLRWLPVFSVARFLPLPSNENELKVFLLTNVWKKLW